MLFSISLLDSSSNPVMSAKTNVASNNVVVAAAKATDTISAVAIEKENSSFVERCYEKSGRECAPPVAVVPPSLSHYSTEKSGSSGYYSSNIYSTSSYDEHIYSEPAIENTANAVAIINDDDDDGGHPVIISSLNVAAIAAASAKTNSTGGLINNKMESMTLPLKVGEHHNILANMKQNHFKQQQQQQQKLGLFNLETSIKHLEMHLNSFNQPISSATNIHDGRDTAITILDESDNKYDKRKSVRLPTIMEGTADMCGSSGRIWKDDPDDSLMDLDLDSFLLANEVKEKNMKASDAELKATTKISSVEKSIIDERRLSISSNNKFIENNYKCSKYVNSCPDDAYNVEGIISDKPTVVAATASIDKSLAFYLNKCDDQEHYQNTKDILQEIREKLNYLLLPSVAISSAISRSFADQNPEKNELQYNILSLKDDLDNYLSLMNKSNELEIKQFCTGLSKNYKLLTIQNALENREKLRCVDMSCSNYYVGDSVVGCNSEATYEQISALPTADGQQSSYRERDESQFDTVYVRDGFSFGYKSKDPFHLDFSATAKVKRTNSAIIAKVLPTTASSSSSLRCSDLSNFQLQQKFKCSPCSSCEEVMNSLSDMTAGDDCSNHSDAIRDVYDGGGRKPISQRLSQLQQNLAMHQHRFPVVGSGGLVGGGHHRDGGGALMPISVDDNDAMLDWHKNKPSIWELYYGTNRMSQTILKKVRNPHSIMSYVSMHLSCTLIKSTIFRYFPGSLIYTRIIVPAP